MTKFTFVSLEVGVGRDKSILTQIWLFKNYLSSHTYYYGLNCSLLLSYFPALLNIIRCFSGNVNSPSE